jgi:hypothetical protein
VLAALPLIVAYFLAFPYPLGREAVLRARWRVPLASGVRGIGGPASAGASGVVRPAPFQLGDVYGFVSPDGVLASLGRTPFAVALSRRGSIAFARVGTTWVFDGPSGEARASFSGDGYPLLSPEGDRIFLVKTDLTGLRELAESGEPVWSRDFPSLLTSVAIQGSWLAVGQLSGSISLVDRKGAVVFEKAPAGSRISATYGVALTEDGSRLAAVTGIGPQLLTLWHRSRDGYAATARLSLGSDFRREVRIAFAPDGRSLACEADDAVLLVHAASGMPVPVSLRGRLSGLVFLEPAGGRCGAWVAAAQNATGAAELAVVRPPGAVLARASLGRQTGEPAAPAGPDGPWLGAAGDSLLVAYAGSLLGIGLEAR